MSFTPTCWGSYEHAPCFAADPRSLVLLLTRERRRWRPRSPCSWASRSARSASSAMRPRHGSFVYAFVCPCLPFAFLAPSVHCLLLCAHECVLGVALQAAADSAEGKSEKPGPRTASYCSVLCRTRTTEPWLTLQASLPRRRRRPRRWTRARTARAANGIAISLSLRLPLSSPKPKQCWPCFSLSNCCDCLVLQRRG